MGTGVGLFWIFGIGVFFLVFPFFAVIYYIFYRKKTKIKTNSLERIDLAQLTKLNSILKNLGHLQNLEQFRVPLIHYANLISERYKLVFLENIVVNLNRSLLNKTFDLVIEQTFFCALNPELRSNYVSKMETLLNPNGKIAGLLFDFPLTEAGPPFGGSENEYLKLFSEKFNIKTLEKAYNSIKPRKDTELFFIFEKK